MKVNTMAAQSSRWYHLFLQIKATLDQWDRNLTTRRQLHKLTDDELSDIGISRTDAENEAQKPFWRE